MRRPNRRLVLPALIAAGLVIAGCGGDDSGQHTAPTISIPAVTAPTVSTFAQPTATATATGGTKTSKGAKTINPGAPDSATNDLPPPPGSPQDAFEKQCEQNPHACG